jgi:hypothetical protein
VQHTVNREALTAGLATGSLDSFLFPQNPIANAPQILNQLRVLFPFKAGGFVIGPMLELGWGTPSLVTARVGVLIEPTQLILVGQVIVQLPPLVDKDLALLYLQIDFAGYVCSTPFQIGFDGVLPRFARADDLALGPVRRSARCSATARRSSSAQAAFHPRFTGHPARHPGSPSSASAPSSRSASSAWSSRATSRSRRRLCRAARRCASGATSASLRSRRLRVQRDHLHRPEVPLRGGHPRMGRGRGVRHRLRERGHLRLARGSGPMGTSSAGRRSTRRGRCPTSLPR